MSPIPIAGDHSVQYKSTSTSVLEAENIAEVVQKTEMPSLTSEADGASPTDDVGSCGVEPRTPPEKERM